MKSLLFAAPLLLAAVPANGGDTPALTPHESVEAGIHAMRNNKLHSFLLHTFGDSAVAEMRTGWNKERQKKAGATESAEFTEFINKLTAPGAEQALMEEFRPQLDEMRPQMTMMVGMFSGLIGAALQEDENLSTEEKRNATQMMDALSRHLMTHDLCDPRSAEKAIGILCRSARKLKLESLQQVHDLTFEALLGKGDIALGALKDIFEIYGFSMDRWLDSVKAETVRTSGSKATVKVSYEFLGIKQSMNAEMVRIGKRWLREEAAAMIETR